MNRRDILKRLAAVVAAVPVVGRLARTEPKVISTGSRVGKTIGGGWMSYDIYLWDDDLTCPLCGEDWEASRGGLLNFGYSNSVMGFAYEECAHGDKDKFLDQCQRASANFDQWNEGKAKDVRRFARYIKRYC